MDFHFSFFRVLSVFRVGRKCRFFQWHDDEICERGKLLIPQQRQRIIKLEAKLADCKKREKFVVCSCSCGIISGDICSSMFA